MMDKIPRIALSKGLLALGLGLMCWMMACKVETSPTRPFTVKLETSWKSIPPDGPEHEAGQEPDRWIGLHDRCLWEAESGRLYVNQLRLGTVGALDDKTGTLLWEGRVKDDNFFSEMFVDPALRSFNRRTNNIGTLHEQNNREDPSIPYVEYLQRWDAKTGEPLGDLNVISKISKEVIDKGLPPLPFGIHLLLPDGSMFFGMGGRMVRIDPSGKPVWIRPEFKEGYEGYVFYTAFADGKLFVAYHTANSSGEDHEKWIQGLQAKAALSEDPDALEIS